MKRIQNDSILSFLLKRPFRNVNKKTKTSISQMIVNKLKDANLILKSTPVAKHISLVLHTVSADQNNLDFEN